MTHTLDGAVTGPHKATEPGSLAYYAARCSCGHTETSSLPGLAKAWLLDHAHFYNRREAEAAERSALESRAAEAGGWVASAGIAVALHHGCSECESLVRHAISLATATGSREATHTEEWVGQWSDPTEVLGFSRVVTRHSCTWRRA